MTNVIAVLRSMAISVTNEQSRLTRYLKMSQYIPEAMDTTPISMGGEIISTIQSEPAALSAGPFRNPLQRHHSIRGDEFLRGPLRLLVDMVAL